MSILMQCILDAKIFFQKYLKGLELGGTKISYYTPILDLLFYVTF